MKLASVLLASALLAAAAPVTARDQIRFVGAAAVLALAQPVIEEFARHRGNPIPTLEVTGNGIGFRLFCAGVGFEHPDLMASSRPITEAERQGCIENGAGDLTEIEVGRDALVLINAGAEPRISLSRGQLFAALAAQVEQNGRIVPNGASRWSDLDPELPAQPILIMAPEPNTVAESNLRDLVMAQACLGSPAIAALDPEERERVCHGLRRDNRLVPPAKHEEKVLTWLKDNPDGFALTSFVTHQHFDGRTAANAVEGVTPTVDTLGDGRYPLAAGLYIYVKDRHVKSLPSLQQLLNELVGDWAIGPDGYLRAKGLVPLDDRSRNRARDQVLRLGL